MTVRGSYRLVQFGTEDDTKYHPEFKTRRDYVFQSEDSDP